MKNIYHIHQSSNSYWDSHWTDTDYYRSSMLSVSAGVRGWREVRITSTILSQARCATRQEVPLLADLQDMEVKLNKIGGETCKIK